MTENAKTSSLVKAAASLTILSFLLLIIGFATPLWSSRPGSSEGLWEICFGKACKSSIHTNLGDQGWFLATQVLVTLAFVLGISAIILVLVLSCHANSGRGLLIATIVHEYVIGLLLLTGVIVYWVEGKLYFTNFNLDFSWGITLASLIVFVIAGILLSVEIDEDDKEKTMKDAGTLTELGPFEHALSGSGGAAMPAPTGLFGFMGGPAVRGIEVVSPTPTVPTEPSV